MLVSSLVSSLVSPLMISFGEEEIPDYNNPYAIITVPKPIYSWTDKILITIIAPSWNSNANLIDVIGNIRDHEIEISTREHSIESYKFVESKANSGIFVAEVTLTGFSHDSNGDGEIDTNPRTSGTGPTDGFLQVDRDSIVTISFEFAENVIPITERVPISWNIGSIEFLNDIIISTDNDNISSTDSVIIQVIDPDMNLNPEAIDNVPIHVFTDRDIAGIKVESVETSENSGSFIADVLLTQSSSSYGDRINAGIGSKITAKYDDHTLPDPFNITDDLEIIATSIVKLDIPDIERLKSSPITFTDSFGNELDTLLAGSSIQLVGKVTNDYSHSQKFVYLVQVKNSKGHVEYLQWIQSELSPGTTFNLSKSWVPAKSGQYIVETFIWDSISNSVALSPLVAALIIVE